MISDLNSFCTFLQENFLDNYQYIKFSFEFLGGQDGSQCVGITPLFCKENGDRISDFLDRKSSAIIYAAIPKINFEMEKNNFKWFEMGVSIFQNGITEFIFKHEGMPLLMKDNTYLYSRECRNIIDMFYCDIEHIFGRDFDYVEGVFCFETMKDDICQTRISLMCTWKGFSKGFVLEDEVMCKLLNLVPGVASARSAKSNAFKITISRNLPVSLKYI